MTRTVDFYLGLGPWGDVQVIANVTPAREAPLAGSEQSRLDPPEPAEVEVLHVRSFGEDRSFEILADLVPYFLEKVRAACVDEAQRLEANGE